MKLYRRIVHCNRFLQHGKIVYRAFIATGIKGKSNIRGGQWLPICKLHIITDFYSPGKTIVTAGILCSKVIFNSKVLGGTNQGTLDQRLMNMLSGIYYPDEGQIFVDGKEVHFSSSSDAIAAGLGMVHQHFMLVPSLTVAENMVLGMAPRKGLFIDHAKAVAITKEYAEKYNLHVEPEAKVMDIPVGMKQKVEILKALYMNARILIMDEPTAVLTPQEIDERNILWATMDGMAQAVAGLEITPDYALIDGNRCPPGLIQPAEAVVKGDANSASIAAASILAKVSRDRYMLELDKQYPQYQLAKHKGYPRKLHYELIAQYGIQPFYRRSFLKKQGYWHD